MESMMNRISISTLLLSVLTTIAAPACAIEAGEEATSVAEQAATGYRIGDYYYYKTDDFDEQCGAGYLNIWTSSGWNNIQRGTSEYFKPLQYSNGTFKWSCGGTIEYSECNDSPADKVRFYWDPYSRRIDMTCYNRCGDGSSYSDCEPY
jgi:hypothetical protein